MKSGYYPITSNKIVWINDIYKSLQATYFDKVFLTEELLLYITDKYKHINVLMLQKIFNELGFSIEYSRAYKDRNHMMRYEWKLEKELGLLWLIAVNVAQN